MRILILFLPLLIFVGCKKYPEDKALVHLKRPKQRLIAGSPWYVKTFTVDGIDSLPNVNAKVNWMESIINKPESIEGKNISFSEDKKLMFLSFFVTYIPLNSDKSYVFWEILELDKKKFIVTTEKNGKKYYLEFISR